MEVHSLFPLQWKCSETEDLSTCEINQFTPPLSYLQVLSIPSSSSSSVSSTDTKPLLLVKHYNNLMIIYEKEIPMDLPLYLSSQVETWIYLEIQSSEWNVHINHWSYFHERLNLLKLSFHLLYFNSKLLLLVQEYDLNLIEFFLTQNPHPQEVSFLSPRFLIRSSIESRNYTILNSLIRLYSQRVFPSSLVIHCLGAESNECEDLSTIPEMYSPLLRVLEAFGVRKISLHFIGPNLFGKQLDHLQIPPADDMSLHLNLVRYCGLYHDYVSLQQPSPPEAIDLLICFNAGFWGYSDWIPTLRLLPSLRIKQTVVTSYSFQESEEDYDAVEEHCCTQSSSHFHIEWNFESELNPFRVVQPMKRLSAPVTSSSDYFENQYWQSFCFIESSTRSSHDF
jgi:hypothetical protein